MEKFDFNIDFDTCTYEEAVQKLFETIHYVLSVQETRITNLETEVRNLKAWSGW